MLGPYGLAVDEALREFIAKRKASMPDRNYA